MEKPSQKIVLLAPPVESLLARDKKSMWGAKILDNLELIKSTEIRLALRSTLQQIEEQVQNPSLELQQAVKAGILSEETVARLYTQLALFLNSDEYNRRAVLYLPFEFLPHTNWLLDSLHLRPSLKHFIDTFMERWRELLEESDVRANFVDGDILEPELAPNGQHLVRKAAHLIPQLVKKGYLTDTEVSDLVRSASSRVLRDSIAEVWDSLNQIKEESSEEAASNLDWFVSLSDTLSSEHKKLEMREALDSSRGLPSARVAWERQDRENRLIAKYAARIKEAVVAGRLFYSDILQLLESNQKLVLSAALRGGGETLESLAVKDLEAAQQTARSFLEKIWSERIVETLDDELESVLVRLTNLGVITEADLFGFGFVLPKLDAEFSGDSSVANELQKFAPAVKRLADKEEWFYPIVIFFGSRLKRYAERKADLDAAVFIKPGIAKTERPRIQNVLRKIFSDKKIQGKVVEFWLEENREGLQVRDFENPDTLLAGSIWTHLLLSGVWLGKSYALKELHTKLLSGLLRPTKMTFMNRPLRIVRLSEMEREVLQYRLMHKGYRRFFAPAGGVNLKTQGPDPQSVFWDSGYRRLATKLFVSRVFMPELDQ